MIVTEYKVYFLRAGTKPQDPLKIGYTRNLDRRITNLQVGCPYKLNLVGAIICESKIHAQKLEKFLHRQLYRSSHLQGEWFRQDKLNLKKLLYKFNTSHRGFNYKEDVVWIRAKNYISTIESENRKLRSENIQLKQDMEDYLDTMDTRCIL